MAEGTSEVAIVAPNTPPKKKSLFSKKILAQAAEIEEGVDFFSRSHEIFPQRLAEEERKRQKKLVKLERKRTSSSVEEKEPSPFEEKRRRVSNQGLYSSDEEPAQASRTRRQSANSTPGSRKSRSASAQKTQASPTSLSGRYSRDLREEKKPAPINYISLTESDDDEPKPFKSRPINLDDDDDVYCITQSQPRKPAVPDPELSDEEFPELVQAARERERQKMLQRQKAAKSFAEKNHASNGLDDDIFDTESSTATADPILEVLISSEIDGTKPLLVKRKLTQKLKEVRLAWCDKQSSEGQPMAQHVKDSIILTWKGKRIYDVHSCQTFNLSFDSTGKPEGDGVDPNGRIHLEAWTQDLYNAYQKTQAAKPQREQNGGEQEEEVVEEVEVKKIKLFLKSKDYGEVKRSVKPTTLVQKLIDSFRQEKEVPENKEISLHVDGDRLDPEDKIEDTDLEDRDAVEVHIR